VKKCYLYRGERVSRIANVLNYTFMKYEAFTFCGLASPSGLSLVGRGGSLNF